MDSSGNLQSEPESGGGKHEGESKKRWKAKTSKSLYEKVREQLEFYFSPPNLAKDRFMTKLIQEDPYVPIQVFMSFNKIKTLLNGGSEKVIQKALSRSTILELSEDQTKVRRKTDLPVKSQEEIDECTLYVEQIPLNSTHDSVKAIFSRFGRVAYVSLPKYKKSRQIKQFGFVEFDDPESVQKAVNGFKKFEGVLQYSSLKAENLLSIATHEKEEVVEKKTEKGEEETGEPPAKKAKVEEGDENMEKGEDKKDLKEPEVEEDKTEDQDEPQESQEDVQEGDSKDQSEKPSEEGNPGDASKKKKNRKHKKKTNSKSQFDECFMAMKVMRKKEWKKMRNTYLNLERQKAKEIKKVLRDSYNKRNNNKIQFQESQKFSPLNTASPRINFYGSPNDREEPTEVACEVNNETGSTGLTFIPGVIVNIKFREPCLDFKELKKEFKQYPYVSYVDILESGAQCYIRVDTSNSAQELVGQYSSCEYETEVLKDDAEKEYWRKIFEKRDSKKSKEIPRKEQPVVKRRRGREKLLDKISKAAQHIRFEETDEPVE